MSEQMNIDTTGPVGTSLLNPAAINASAEFNSRHYSPTPAQVDRMMLSFLDVGQQQACRVRYPLKGAKDQRVRLIQGFKRHAAATGISESQGEPFYLRCEVEEDAVGDEEAFVLSARENVDRDDLSPMDKAFAVDRHIAEFGKKGKEAAVLFRVSAPTVSVFRKLVAKLCPGGQKMVHEGNLTVEGALDLIKLFPDLEAQEQAIVKMVKKGAGAKKKAGRAAVTGASPAPSNMRSSKQLRKEVVAYIGEKDLTTKAVETALEAGEELPLLYTEGYAEEDLKFRRAFFATLQKYLDGKAKFKVLLKALDATIGL